MSSNDRGTQIILRILELAQEAVNDKAILPAGLPDNSVGSYLLGIALAQYMSEGFSIEDVHKVVEEFKKQAFGIPS